MNKWNLIGALFLALIPSLGAAEPAAEPADEPLPLDFKLSFSALFAFPDTLGLSVAVGMPNVAEIEAGAAMLFGTETLYIRAGYPLRALRKKDRGHNLFVIPKVGYRYLRYHTEPLLGACGPTGDNTSSQPYRTADLGGINGAVSLDWVYSFSSRFGLLIQLTGGATYLVKGYDAEVRKHCDEDELEYIGSDRSVTPDVRISFGFVY